MRNGEARREKELRLITFVGRKTVKIVHPISGKITNFVRGNIECIHFDPPAKAVVNFRPHKGKEK